MQAASSSNPFQQEVPAGCQPTNGKHGHSAPVHEQQEPAVVPESAVFGTVDLWHEHKPGSQHAASVAERAVQETQAVDEDLPGQLNGLEACTTSPV